MPNIVITGANRGIGLELARQYSERGDHVIAACRKASPELIKLGIDIFEGLDVSDTASVNRFANSLENTTINTLINNAGILTSETLDDMDWDRIPKTV